MNTVIASTRFYGKLPGQKRRFAIEWKIGTPYRVAARPEEWACPVSLQPLCERLADAHGIDSLQALCLAISLGLYLLGCFQEDGGVLSLADGKEFDIRSGLGIRSTFGLRLAASVSFALRTPKAKKAKPKSRGTTRRGS